MSTGEAYLPCIFVSRSGDFYRSLMNLAGVRRDRFALDDRSVRKHGHDKNKFYYESGFWMLNFYPLGPDLPESEQWA